MDLTVSAEHAAFAPREVIAELAFVSLSVVEPHLAEALHLATSELPLVLHPICPETHDAPSALVVIVLPTSLVDQVSRRIVKLALALHFALGPVSQVVASVVINVFSLSMTQVLFLLALVSVSVCVYLTDLHFWPVL